MGAAHVTIFYMGFAIIEAHPVIARLADMTP